MTAFSLNYLVFEVAVILMDIDLLWNRCLLDPTLYREAVLCGPRH